MTGPEAAQIILKKHDIPGVTLSSHMEPQIVQKAENIISYGYVLKKFSGTGSGKETSYSITRMDGSYTERVKAMLHEMVQPDRVNGNVPARKVRCHFLDDAVIILIISLINQ